MTLTKTGTYLFYFLSLAVALVSYRFLAAGVTVSMPAMVAHLADRPWVLYAHIGFAPLALAILPFQFSTKLRMRRPGLHRWLGRGYGLAIAISGVAGLIMGLTTQAGTAANWGFSLLAIVWLGVTGRAIWLAMTRRIDLHKRWMIRSAALTLAAVTLRIELPILAGIFGFETGYPIVAWTCWVPNAIAAEWWLRRKRV
jgi:hypothetical protein